MCSHKHTLFSFLLFQPSSFPNQFSPPSHVAFFFSLPVSILQAKSLLHLCLSYLLLEASLFSYSREFFSSHFISVFLLSQHSALSHICYFSLVCLFIQMGFLLQCFYSTFLSSGDLKFSLPESIYSLGI